MNLDVTHAELYSDVWGPETEAEVRKLAGPIVVIGASGFIGAKLFFSLLARRDDVFAISSSIEASWRLNGVAERYKRHFKAVDITQPDHVKSFISSVRPRTIFNLAAYGAYERQSDIERIHEVNYMGNVHLLMALQEYGCDAFVHAGSSSEYGLNCTAPSEDGELLPNSHYAVSKGASSLLIKYYGKILNFACVNLRLYSIYGPWEERDRLIPRLIERGLEKQFPPFADRTISRDFVYVDDCTRAFVKAALAAPQIAGESINIATGQATTLEDVAFLAKETFGIADDPSFGTMANRRWDLSRWYGDPKKAVNKIGWSASTDFKTGFTKTVEWEAAAQSVIRFGFVPARSKKISAIIACYRDDQAIPIMYRRLTDVFQKEGVDYEIIFVNDQSPTDDEKVIAGIAREDSRVIGISHSRNFGSQAAFMSGMEISTGDAVVLMDGDLQDPPEVISDFIRKWDQGYDIVYGQRIKREAALYMQVLYKIFYRVFRNLSDVPIPVDAGDFSLIDRKALNHLISLPERDQFIRGLRAWIGFKQVGAPYHRPERAFGTSTNNFFKNIWWAKKAIFSFSSKPLHYMQGAGLALVALTGALILFYFVSYLISPNVNPRGTNTIILLLLGLGGAQIFCVSILGDYIGKILEEVKQRPHFIRSRIVQGGVVFDTQDRISTYVKERKDTH